MTHTQSPGDKQQQWRESHEDCEQHAQQLRADHRRLDGLAMGQVAATDPQVRLDLIVGSDLLYERDADDTLVAFIARHAAPLAEVWIVDPDRGNRPAFNRGLAARGFDHREERLSTPLPAGAGTLPGYKGRLLVYRRGGGGGTVAQA